jgi:tetratricopeptide (TPR) repeat protein
MGGGIGLASTGAALLVHAAIAGAQEPKSLQQRMIDVSDAIRAVDEAAELSAEHPDRARQLLRKAAQGYETIIASGVANGKLFYNLANVRMRLDEVGKAILWYRRAQRLLPGDSKLSANLELARQRRRNRFPQPQARALLREVFFWHYGVSISSRANAAMIFYGLGWLILSANLVVSGRSLKVVGAISMVVGLTSGGSVVWQQHAQSVKPEAVIVADDVGVYQGASRGYGLKFEEPLHQGVEVRSISEQGQWRHIELPDGKTGWVQAEQVERI